MGLGFLIIVNFLGAPALWLLFNRASSLVGCIVRRRLAILGWGLRRRCALRLDRCLM